MGQDIWGCLVQWGEGGRCEPRERSYREGGVGQNPKKTSGKRAKK